MSRTNYPIHPDFWFWAHMHPPLGRATLPPLQRLLRLCWAGERSGRAMTVSRHAIPTADGGTVRALFYAPAGLDGQRPCLLFYHGGGFVFPASPHHFALAREYARRAACTVLLVDYRLAPQHPFPAAPEDCFAAYRWAIDHARELSLDPGRIAVGGDSAGGELATVVCLMARERGDRLPCAQLLLYPVTGRGQETESMKKYTDTPMCSSRDMEKYDRYYVPEEAAGRPEYASPIHAASLTLLPPAYVETAEFDCLRDGAILYAKRLEECGVPVELYNTQGTIHGYDVVKRSPIVRASMARRVAFLRRGFDLPGETG